MRTQKKCNISEKQGLSLLKKHFKLHKETQSSLRELLEYKRITNNRCRFSLTPDGQYKRMAKIFYLGHQIANGEKKASEFHGRLCRLSSTKFIIDNDEKALSNYVKSYCENDSNHFFVEKIEGTDYFVASNG